MSEFLGDALKKLDEGVSGNASKNFGTKENVMKNAVRDALAEFCRQDTEFAQAVVQGGGFADCMKAVAKGIGGSISDLEAFRRAAQFYFPGADIAFHITVDLCASVSEQGEPERKPNQKTEPKPEPKPKSKTGAIVIDLTDFF